MMRIHGADSRWELCVGRNGSTANRASGSFARSSINFDSEWVEPRQALYCQIARVEVQRFLVAMLTQLHCPIQGARAAIILALALSAVFGERPVPGQQAPKLVDRTSANSPALPRAYDVISIKPHKDSLTVDSGANTGGDRWAETDITARDLIMSAYHLVMLDQISGLPDWANNEHFDIEAKLDPDNAEALARVPREVQESQTRLMLRAALADRFKLRASLAKKELPVYNLVIARGGPKLKEASPTNVDGYFLKLGPVCGIKSKRIDMSTLAANLSDSAGRLVIDKTGLPAKYELALTWAINDKSTSSAPSLFTALPEQLGLKLEPARAPVDVVVIDHLERPSEN